MKKLRHFFVDLPFVFILRKPFLSIAINKKLNSTERGALFRNFGVSKVITTAHTHKSGVIFHIFPRAFKQKKKIQALRPKMTKVTSRGSCLKAAVYNLST